MDRFGIDVWPAVLAFARMGAFAMLLPGLGETFVSPRFRLSAALLMALVTIVISNPMFLLILSSSTSGKMLWSATPSV